MDIRQLEYFVEVAKQLNFTKAASSLHISQPSLSKTIKSMEERINRCRQGAISQCKNSD